MMTRPLCKDAVELVKRFEGLRLTAYLCPAGIPTIGYGHTLTVTFEDVRGKKTISRAEAEALQVDDLARAAQQVDDLVSVEITDAQLGALTSFSFNMGAGNLAKSTLLRKLNAGDFLGASQEFDRWVMAVVGGKRVCLPGLVKRRVAEKALFLCTPTPTSPPDLASLTGLAPGRFICNFVAHAAKRKV